jgi:S1-C subfamily serine protease
MTEDARNMPQPNDQPAEQHQPAEKHPAAAQPAWEAPLQPGAYWAPQPAGYGGQPGPYGSQPGPYAGSPQPGPYAGQHNPYGTQPGPWGPPSHYWTPPAPGAAQPSGGAAKPPNNHRFLIGSVAAAAAVALSVGAVAFSVEQSRHGSSQQASVTTPGTQTNPFSGNGNGSDGNGYSGNGSGGNQFGWSNPFGQGGTGGGFGGSSGSGSSASTGTATAAQQVGVVDINTVLDFGTSKAAGTGLVLSSSGKILTNNHVIAGSTSISVTVVSTGKSYTASVVGTDPTDDVAVLQLAGASGLSTANLGDSSKVTVGTAVTAVGNAGGTGGTPSSAKGTITALDQSITASDSDGSNAEKLTGMFQLNADIQPGDSGGPLYNSSNQVIGIDTAASSSQSAQTVGFAIPIAKAVSIAQQINSGTETSTIHLGYPAFLGVQLAASPTTTSGPAAVAGVVPNSAAAKAGIAAGSTITKVDGTSIASATALSSAMAKHNPGDSVSVSWTDANGASHTATVTLGTGPAD